MILQILHEMLTYILHSLIAVKNQWWGILIVLWMLAAKEDISYMSVLICFVTFLFNDIYGFVSWIHMEKRQQKAVALAY